MEIETLKIIPPKRNPKDNKLALLIANEIQQANLFGYRWWFSCGMNGFHNNEKIPLEVYLRNFSNPEHIPQKGLINVPFYLRMTFDGEIKFKSDVEFFKTQKLKLILKGIGTWK